MATPTGAKECPFCGYELDTQQSLADHLDGYCEEAADAIDWRHER